MIDIEEQNEFDKFIADHPSYSYQIRINTDEVPESLDEILDYTGCKSYNNCASNKLSLFEYYKNRNRTELFCYFIASYDDYDYFLFDNAEDAMMFRLQH